MIILGLDPGLATTGFGVLEVQNGKMNVINLGTITTPAGETLSHRLKSIAHDVEQLIATYHPEVCGVEELFFTKNLKTGIAVSHARGVLLLILEQNGIPIIELTPLEVKSQVTGYGKADKKQIQKMLALTFGWTNPPTQDDANDALAIALATSHLWTFQKRI